MEIARRKIRRCPLGTVGNVSDGVNPYGEPFGSVPGFLAGSAVKINERAKALRVSTNDRDHQGQPQHSGTNERLRRATNTEPNRQRVLNRTGIDALTGERSAVLAGPVNRRVLTNL